jgi:hypothetical protein
MHFMQAVLTSLTTLSQQLVLHAHVSAYHQQHACMDSSVVTPAHLVLWEAVDMMVPIFVNNGDAKGSYISQATLVISSSHCSSTSVVAACNSGGTPGHERPG